MRIKYKKLDPAAHVPYKEPCSNGYDLFALTDQVVSIGTITQIRTGIAMNIPDGYVGLIWDKSGIAAKYGLKVMGGVIDNGYIGEIMVCLTGITGAHQFLAGEKIAQILFMKTEYVVWNEVESLGTTERGEGGFGSTGK